MTNRNSTIDNSIYNKIGDSWWQEGSFLNVLKLALNPPRLCYLDKYLPEVWNHLKGKKVLEVGCGGGLFLEEFAKRGAQCFGVDPAKQSLETAFKHAKQEGLKIDYREGYGEKIPHESGEFDLVLCCDVLEHVNDLGQVISEISRVLKPEGVFLYDTFNRNPISKLVAIKIFQEWKATAFMMPNTHDWKLFIKPKELIQHFGRHDLRSVRMKGIAPKANFFSAFRALRLRAQGKIGFPEFSRRVRLSLSYDKSVMYIGHTVKGKLH